MFLKTTLTFQLWKKLIPMIVSRIFTIRPETPLLKSLLVRRTKGIKANVKERVERFQGKKMIDGETASDVVPMPEIRLSEPCLKPFRGKQEKIQPQVNMTFIAKTHTRTHTHNRKLASFCSSQPTTCLCFQSTVPNKLNKAQIFCTNTPKPIFKRGRAEKVRHNLRFLGSDFHHQGTVYCRAVMMRSLLVLLLFFILAVQFVDRF